MSPLPGADSLSSSSTSPRSAGPLGGASARQADKGRGEGPDHSIEDRLIAGGLGPVAGVDEAGRGPLAGPVVAAAVILDPHAIPAGLDDSKKLSALRRELLFAELARSAHIAWATADAGEIDRVNIREASLLAMSRAVAALSQTPGHVLVDGRDVPAILGGRATALVRGDGRALSVAAASIIAKVVRDRLMVRACALFPQYGFSRHKGYGSREHLDAITRHGPCPLHRMSFAPLRGAD